MFNESFIYKVRDTCTGKYITLFMMVSLNMHLPYTCYII